MVRRTLLEPLASSILLAGCTFAQTPTTPVKPMAFEVVSIRQNDGSTGKQTQFDATPTGYRATNMQMFLLVAVAYAPASGAAIFPPGNVLGAPEWATKGRYDIDARVSGSDLASWQNPALQPEMLRTMLQTMLAERTKLAVHHDSKEESVYSLVVAKSGLKIKESVPGAPRPAGRSIPGGAVIGPPDPDGTAHLYGITMGTFAALLSSGMAGRPVQDETGLTAKYDFAMLPAAKPNMSTSAEATDPGPTIFTALAALGLKLEPAKRQVETLVIDHMEPPTEN